MYGNPRLVVLDEPNSNLDAVGDAALTRAIGHLKGQGCTVVLVTHRSASLAQADKLLVLNEGRCQVFGPSAEVLKALSAAQSQQAAPQAASINRQSAEA